MSKGVETFMNRRSFIVGSTVTLLSAVTGYSYLFSKCPLDTEGEEVCTGPCTAFIDLNGDGACDRLPAPARPPAQAAGDGGDSSTVERVCPFGLVDDPYPGACKLYVDADGDGICDLSQNHPAATVQPAAEQDAAPPTPAGEPNVLTACPLGLVNDPYPGECKWYVDTNGNSICDLSEPELVASGAVAPVDAGVAPLSDGTQQQRRRRGRDN
jgi:hypothetical protein